MKKIPGFNPHENLISLSARAAIAEALEAGAEVEVGEFVNPKIDENNPALNREAWLQAAVAKLRPIFLGHGFTIPEVQVSVGWPSSGGLATKKKTIGQCWFGSTTADGKPQLFISPLLDEVASPQGVLATLVHEICHVAAGPDAKHGPKFKKIATKMGLTGKPTSTEAGDDLKVRLQQLAEELGKFDHSRIVPSDKTPKKQSTRMKKCSCGSCGYVARTVKKWLDEVGSPICPCNNEPMEVELAEDGDGGDE